jgi:hypothetical protein
VGNKATEAVLLERTAHPGVYRRGGQYVAVYRRDGRQRKESAATFAQARAIKLTRDAEASEQRRGPTLHDYALRWVARHAGSGHDTMREQTRKEYRRLLATYYGARAIPLAEELTGRLRALRPPDAEDEDLVFPNRRGRPLNPNNLRNRVLKPAAERAAVPGIGLHALRHTCASLLIEERTSSLRLQRWMGHHAAACTLETYGHLINDELGRALELEDLGVHERREVGPTLTAPSP